jgi:type IV pilus assembly protein PilB
MFTEDELRSARALADRRGISMSEALVEQRSIDEVELLRWLGRLYGAGWVDLRAKEIDSTAARLIPREAALRLGVVALERVGAVLIVAVSDPSRHDALQELETLTGYDIEAVVAADWRVRAALEDVG